MKALVIVTQKNAQPALSLHLKNGHQLCSFTQRLFQILHIEINAAHLHKDTYVTSFENIKYNMSRKSNTKNNCRHYLT